MSPKQPFTKPFLSLQQQVELMTKRGLVVNDQTRTEHYLRFIGYCRLVAYARHFCSGDSEDPERYLEGTSFSDVLDLYIFDRKVRLLIFDAIERVEIAVRTTISNIGSLYGGGPFWLTNANNFDYGCHDMVVREIEIALGDVDGENHQHSFITHFYKKYSDPYPPGWMLIECFSMGAISRIYKHLKGNLRQNVSGEFSLQHDILESWLHSLTHCRNICAHHSLCWKRVFTIQPKIPKCYQRQLLAANKLYAQCWMVNHFMKLIADGSRWSDRLRSLIDTRPKTTTLSDLGFPDDWKEHQFWSGGTQATSR